MKFLGGVDLHPQFCGADLKQFTPCRIGMMSWQILILAFYYTSHQRHGFNPGIAVNAVLQTLFIALFFTPETRYFKTLEIEQNRPGYFLIWGSMVFVPFFFSYSTYHLVAHPSLLTTNTSCLVGALGIILILVMFHTNHRKQLFKVPVGHGMSWGTYNVEIHIDSRRPNQAFMLLYPGYIRRISRHVNFILEILLSFCWCFPNIGVGISGFLYVIFLMGLLVYRLIIEKTVWRLSRDGSLCLQQDA